MEAIVIEKANILVPNKEHKNFTESNEFIEKNSLLDGNAININGLRRGKPFTYRLFVTKNNDIIYLNKIKPMKATEVTLGADSTVTPTKVDLIPAEAYTKNKFTGLVVGGLAGFAWAKYKKHDMKKAAMYIGIGAVAGYVTGMLLDRRNKIIVKPSK